MAVSPAITFSVFIALIESAYHGIRYNLIIILNKRLIFGLYNKASVIYRTMLMKLQMLVTGKKKT